MSESETTLPVKVMPSMTLRETLADQKALATVFLESGLMKSAQSQAQAIVFMMAGAEMGLQPYESMNAFDIIEGRVAMRANTRAAQVKRSGRYNYRVVEHTEQICRIEWFERVDGKWEPIGESSFTIEQANRANLTNKKNWREYGVDMLFNRALSRGQRQHCPEVTGGSRYYDPDEVGEEEEFSPGETPVKEGSLADIKSKVAKKVAVAPVPEPVIEAQFTEEPAEEPAPPKRGPGRPPKKAEAAPPVESAPEPQTPQNEGKAPEMEQEAEEAPAPVEQEDPNRVVMDGGEVLTSTTEVCRYFGLPPLQDLFLRRLSPTVIAAVRLCERLKADFNPLAEGLTWLREGGAQNWRDVCAMVGWEIDAVPTKEAPVTVPAQRPAPVAVVDQAAVRESLADVLTEEGLDEKTCQWLVEQGIERDELVNWIAHLRSQDVEAAGRLRLHAEGGYAIDSSMQSDGFER